MDTDTSLLTDYMVRMLSASPYSLGELNEILTDEVYPVCHWNLFSIAGEWAGFDEDWLERRIVARRNSPFRSLHWLNLGRITVRSSHVWRRVMREVAAQRAMRANAPSDGGMRSAG